MKRTWEGENFTWERQQTDKLTDYWSTHGENYYYEIHPSVIGWKLYERRGVSQNPLQMVGSSPNMKPLRIYAQGRDTSL